MKTLDQLPDISEVKGLCVDDQPLVDDVISVLKKHNALGRFGLTLLHQHFAIDHGKEVMVESTNVESRIQTIQPVSKAELGDLDYTETSWRFDTGKPVMACVCVKFQTGHTHVSRG